MSEDPAGWLAREVSDLLDASSVGLYEFIWLLRGAYPDATDVQLRGWAAEALRQLIDDGQGQLVLRRWPSEETIAAPPPLRAGDEDWGEPAQDHPYLAITRG